MGFDISKFEKCNILVVGDLMVDEYLWGNVDRISPEAPVQIVSVKEENSTLGGAGNVVNNLIALGAKVSLAGVIGSDRYGHLLLAKLNELGVNTDGVIEEPERPTTRKTRIIANNQQVLRIDRETKKDISQQTLDIILNYIESVMPEVDLVLISDYGKGLITTALLSSLTSVVKKHKKISIADPKGRDFLKYSGVSLLTPNKKEAAIASGIEIVDESTLIKAGNRLLKAAKINNLLITCGKNGMVLFEHNKKPYYISAQTRQVFDVSGAGDTVIAVLGLVIASGASFAKAASIANTAAGIVVSKVGTSTVSKNELLSALTPACDYALTKHMSFSELPAVIQKLKADNKKIVLTNGCFDLLHSGHIMLLSASKKLGDVLFVAIDDDKSVSSLKGHGRPIISEKERISILSALDSVDYVVVFSSKQLNQIIEIIRPDILTKGGNYIFEDVIGRELVERCGGRVVLVPVTKNISSSSIINNIRNCCIKPQKQTPTR
ncbi:MAG: D-glycero-beta-D-manno-heptose-7-phosphate kinase [Candidatus Desulfaltia sp.]|nr:D-glycero-beta-D-manno-heptose-7-phosphate kinase [Candidatus Desulfaltia sp.]